MNDETACPEISNSICSGEAFTENSNRKQELNSQPDEAVDCFNTHARATASSEERGSQLGSVDESDSCPGTSCHELKSVGEATSSCLSNADIMSGPGVATGPSKLACQPTLGVPNCTSTSNGILRADTDPGALKQPSAETPQGSPVISSSWPPSTTSPCRSGEATVGPDMTERSLHSDQPDGADGGPPLDLEASSPGASGGVYSPLSELSEDPVTGGDGGHTEARPPPATVRRTPPNGLRVDVEAEARLFNLTDRVASLSDENRALQDKLRR